MLKANEARTRVEVIINEEREGIILKAREYCETVADQKIKEAIAIKAYRTIIKCDYEIKEEVYNYLKNQGYTVYICGHNHLEIRW